MLKVVFDSNVYISALLFDGTPKSILGLAIERRIILAISDEIIKETTRKLQEKFYWPKHRIIQFERQIRQLAELHNPRKHLEVIDDEADNRVIECAVASDANIIISGDKHLLKLKSYNNIPIQNPKYLTYIVNG